MGRATEELAARSGPGIGGLLNVTFGNAPELIIALFALGEGLQEVVKASIVGSIIGNILLVLGAAMLVGGLGREKQTFSRTGGQRPDVDAASRRRGAADAGDLRAGRGQGPAGAGRRAGRLRLDGRAPLARGRDRPHRHLRRRALLLAAAPTATSSTRRTHEERGAARAGASRRSVLDAGDRRRRGRRDVGDPGRLDHRGLGVDRPLASSSSA